MDSAIIDILVKFLLTLLGAALGVLLKVYSDRNRLSAIVPIVLEQTKRVALIYSKAYSVADVITAEPALETVFRSMLEIVGMGVRPVCTWREGASLFLQTSIAAKEVTTNAIQNDEGAIQALDKLRNNGAKLLQWVNKAEKKL